MLRHLTSLITLARSRSGMTSLYPILIIEVLIGWDSFIWIIEIWTLPNRGKVLVSISNMFWSFIASNFLVDGLDILVEIFKSLVVL